MWPWACYLIFLCLFPILKNEASNRTHFIGWLWGLNELIYINYLEQYRAHNQPLVHITYLWPEVLCPLPLSPHCTRSDALGWEHTRNILFFCTINFPGSCGLVHHRPLVFWTQDFWVLLWSMVFLFVFHVGNKKKKAKLACFSSFLPAGDRGWWRPDRPFSFFLFKTSISQKRVATFQLLHWLFGRWSAFIPGLPRGQSSLRVPGLWVPCLCNPPAWTVPAGGGPSGHVWGMNEWTHRQGIPSLFLPRGHEPLRSRAAASSVLPWLWFRHQKQDFWRRRKINKFSLSSHCQ